MTLLPSEANSARFAKFRSGKIWVIIDTERPGGEWIDEVLYHSLKEANKAADTIRSKRPSSSWGRDPYSAGVQVMDAAYYTPALERVEALKLAGSKGELPKELQENIDSPPPLVQKLKEEMMNSKKARSRIAWAEGEQGSKDWEKWFESQDQEFQDTWNEMNDKYKDVVKNQHNKSAELLPIEQKDIANASLVGTPAEDDMDGVRNVLFNLGEQLQKVLLTIYKHRSTHGGLDLALKKLNESQEALKVADNVLADLL